MGSRDPNDAQTVKKNIKKQLCSKTHSQKVGVLDIGSNSIRLVVYTGMDRVPIPVFNEKVLCKLGEDLEKTGRLSEVGCRIAIDNIARFTKLVKRMELSEFHAVATAALREALNGSEFVEELERRFHLQINILSGESEATLSALGVLSAFPNLDGVIADLGGGSLELINVVNGKIQNRISLPLGSLRLRTLKNCNPSSFMLVIKDELSRVSWVSKFNKRPVFAVGGSWRNLARMHMSADKYPLRIIHGYKIASASFILFLEKITHSSLEELEAMGGVSKKRIKEVTISAGILKSLLELGETNFIIFSAFGIREGCIFKNLSLEMQKKDPLLITCEKIASTTRRFTLTSDELENWALPLFRNLDKHNRRLLKAACILSDFAWADHPSYRAEQAFFRILRFPAIGLAHDDRVFLALTILVRYGGNLSELYLEKWNKVISRERLDIALKIGAAIRLGITLSSGLDGLLHQIEMVKNKKIITIRYAPEVILISGEVITQKIENLSNHFNCSVELQSLSSKSVN